MPQQSCQNLYRTGKQSLGGHNRKLCNRTQEKGKVTPQDTVPELPVGVQESPEKVWVSGGLQGTLKSLLQHHSSKASIFRYSAFFTVQLSHPYMTTGKTIALTRQTFVGKVVSQLFNMLSRLVITFLPRSKTLLIS